jgi:hypothetical protein
MSKFNDFLGKVGGAIKDNGADIAGIAVKAATGNLGGAISDVTSLLKGEDSQEAKALLNELEIRRMEFEKEMYELEVKDRESARLRQVELAKTGNKDYMMTVSGIVALAVFLVAVLVGLFTELTEAQEKVYLHILGIVEGVALTIWNFYYGSSSGSKDKDNK